MLTLFVIVVLMQQLIVMAYGKWTTHMFVFSVQVITHFQTRIPSGNSLQQSTIAFQYSSHIP